MRFPSSLVALSALVLSACVSSDGAGGPSGASFLAGEAAFATRTCVQNGFAPGPVHAAFVARGYRVQEITTTKDLELAQPGAGALAAKRFVANGQNPCVWYPGGPNGQTVFDAAGAELMRLGYVETGEKDVWAKGGRKVRLSGKTIRNIGAGINGVTISLSAVK